MSLLKQGISQVTAAAKAGMSERTARKYVRSGGTPSEAKAPKLRRRYADSKRNDVHVGGRTLAMRFTGDVLRRFVRVGGLFTLHNWVP